MPPPSFIGSSPPSARVGTERLVRPDSGGAGKTRSARLTVRLWRAGTVRGRGDG